MLEISDDDIMIVFVLPQNVGIDIPEKKKKNKNKKIKEKKTDGLFKLYFLGELILN